MINGLTQFADSTSGLGALGIDGKALIIQLITFVLAFVVLQRWAFKPIVKVMERRRETIEKGVHLGEQMKKEQAELEEKVAKTLHEARSQADGIVANAHAQARQTVSDAEDKAGVKADGIIAAAQDRIAQDTTRARKQLEHDVVNLISEATEAIIDEKVDAKKDAALIDKALKGSREA
jgi:F-type H+-transporting ATPase subunit b